MNNGLLRIFERYALLSLEKQTRLDQVLGEHTVDIDLDAGVARFSEGRAYPFQVLGTESENSLTWLWAWADEQTEVADSLLASARHMKVWGEQQGISELTLPSLDLDRADGTMLSLIASEVCGASGFYRDHYTGGNLFLLLTGVAVDERQVFDRRGLVRQFADLASRYDFNHRNALLAYLEARSGPCTPSGSMMSTELLTGERLVVEFDAGGQVRTINGDPLF
jgi:hypothetical protein